MMTDLTPTTNKQIALELGYKKLTAKQMKRYRMAYGVLSLWRDPKGDLCEGIPDFEHDWAHAGPLWGEMVRGLSMRQATNRVSAEAIATMGFYPSDDELKLSICRAWLAWKKEGK